MVVCTNVTHQGVLLQSKTVAWSTVSSIVYSEDIAKALYITQKQPHLEYATHFWDTYLTKDIEVTESLHVKYAQSNVET